MTRHHRLSEKLRLSSPSLHVLRRRLSRAFCRFCNTLASLFPFTKFLGFSFNFSFLAMDDLHAASADDSIFYLDYTSQPTPLLTYFPEDDYDDIGAKKLYLVPYRWWKEARHNDENMESILYSAVLKDDSELQIQLNLRREDNPCVEDEEEGFSGQEFAFVQEAMWLRALKWCHDSTARESAFNPVFFKDNMLDVFPLKIRLSVSSTKSLSVKICITDNTLDCYEKACNIFTSQNEPLHIWDFSGQIALFVNNAITCSISSGHASEEVLLELEVHGLSSFASDGARRDTEMIANNSTTKGNSYYSSLRLNGVDQTILSVSGKTSVPDSCNSYMMPSYIGQKGLYNLGNTCFMNSAIQCLVHTPKLVDYFLGDFQNELNDENPLGMKGELALAFGDLLRKIWAPGATPITPRAFKAKLSKFAPQFSGYNQHDSQEFLAFLLDGLHEDLNRVKQKPYIENEDHENRLDEEVADEFWKNHLARNDSIIVDLCQGQFRSKLVCPVCKKVSITFDPFMYLTLPLPYARTRSMTITVIAGNELPSPITVSVPKCGTFKDLIQALSTECSLGSDETLLVAEVYNHKIFRYLDGPSDKLDLIRDDDQIVAYRLPKETETSLDVEFMHRRDERNSTLSTQSRGFDFPLVGRFSGLSYGSDLRKAFLNLVSPFLSKSEDELYENSQSPNPLNVNSVTDDAPVPWDLDSEPETEDDSCASNTFQFSDSELAFSPVKMHEPLKGFGKRIKIIVTWPEKMIEKYDMHLFNSLPEICRCQFMPEESAPLQKCLEAFLKEEPLGPDDMWYCPSCKMHQQASKKLDLWRLPEILVIHLKRFSFSENYKSKLETFVDFPLDDLDLSSYIAHSQSGSRSSCRYSLYSISNHYGGMGGGHYTAFVQHGVHKWFKFDDHVVAPICRDEIKTSAAYVLFYRRVSEI